MSVGHAFLELNIFHLLPSLLATLLLLVKLFIFWLVQHSDRRISSWLWGFLIGLCGVNFFEFLSYLSNWDQDYALIGLLCFYAFLIVTTLSFLGLSLELQGRLTRFYKPLIGVFAAINALVLIIPGAAISGVEYIGYSITRIPGPYYWVLQLGMIGPLVLGAFNLWQCANDGRDWVNSRKALVALLASIPFILVLVIVVLYMQLAYQMQLDAKYNAAIILSLAINIILVVLFYAEEEHRMFSFLSNIPGTREHKLLTRVRKKLFDNGIPNIKEITNMNEQEIALDAVRRYGGNKSRAARELSVSRATLLRKLGNGSELA